jgi:hypothetical protein
MGDRIRDPRICCEIPTRSIAPVLTLLLILRILFRSSSNARLTEAIRDTSGFYR